MKPRKISPIDEFIALPEEEKQRIVAEFDKEFVFETARPLSPAQRKLWNRIKRKHGRPRKGLGHKVISVSLEKGLLKRADAFVKKSGTTRAALIARGLESILPADKREKRSRAA
jgi:hypothetical protein